MIDNIVWSTHTTHDAAEREIDDCWADGTFSQCNYPVVKPKRHDGRTYWRVIITEEN